MRVDLYPRRGLGDTVHRVAHPVAKAIDRVAGTNLANCGGCAKRREALNRAFPAKKPGVENKAQDD